MEPNKKGLPFGKPLNVWLRGQDLNLRPSGYEADFAHLSTCIINNLQRLPAPISIQSRHNSVTVNVRRSQSDARARGVNRTQVATKLHALHALYRAFEPAAARGYANRFIERRSTGVVWHRLICHRIRHQTAPLAAPPHEDPRSLGQLSLTQLGSRMPQRHPSRPSPRCPRGRV